MAFINVTVKAIRFAIRRPRRRPSPSQQFMKSFDRTIKYLEKHHGKVL